MRLNRISGNVFGKQYADSRRLPGLAHLICDTLEARSPLDRTGRFMHRVWRKISEKDSPPS